jgi:hypothetical protein
MKKPYDFPVDLSWCFVISSIPEPGLEDWEERADVSFTKVS